MMNFRVAPILPTSLRVPVVMYLSFQTDYLMLSLSLRAFPSTPAFAHLLTSCSLLRQELLWVLFYLEGIGRRDILNDEQNKYYQLPIYNDEQTGSITWTWMSLLLRRSIEKTLRWTGLMGNLAEHLASRYTSWEEEMRWLVCVCVSLVCKGERGKLMTILFHANADGLWSDADTFRDFSSFNWGLFLVEITYCWLLLWDLADIFEV